MAYIIIWGAWIIWIPAVLLQKGERGEKGSMSILPVFPCFPIMASLACWGLNKAKEDLGDTTIGGLHILLIICMLVGGILSLYRIRHARLTK